MPQQAQGVRRPGLPVAPARYDAADQQRSRSLIQQFMFEVHGRFLNEQAVRTEAWDGSALAIGFDSGSGVHTDHEIFNVGKAGLYSIDTVITSLPHSSATHIVIVRIQKDPDGVSGYSTVDTYTWTLAPPANVNTWPFTFIVEDTTIVTGGKLRIEGVASGSEGFALNITPKRVRSQ